MPVGPSVENPSTENGAHRSPWADTRLPGWALVSVQRADAPDLVTGHRTWGVLVDRDKVMTPGPGRWLSDPRVRHEILVVSRTRDEDFFLVERLGIRIAEIAGDPPGSPGSIVAMVLDRESRHRPFIPTTPSTPSTPTGSAGRPGPAVASSGSTGPGPVSLPGPVVPPPGSVPGVDLWAGLVAAGSLPADALDHDPQEVLGWVQGWEERRRRAAVHEFPVTSLPRYLKFTCCPFPVCWRCR